MVMKVAVFSNILVWLALTSGCGGSAEPPKEPSASGSPTVTPPGTTPSDLGPPAQTTTTDGLSAGGAGGTKLPPAPSASAPATGSSEPGRSPQEIATVVKARRDEFRACYDKTLKRRPGIEGDVHVRWLIDPKGNVTDVAIDEAKSAFVDVEMGKCIGDVLKTIKFPESPKGMETRAHYPFNFNPRSGGKTPPPTGSAPR